MQQLADLSTTPETDIGTSLELDPAGLDLREVEDVLDDPQQRVAPSSRRVDHVVPGRASSRVWRSTSIMPITPFIGVRISWLMVATKADLARLASSAPSRACSSSAVRSATFASRFSLSERSASWV